MVCVVSNDYEINFMLINDANTSLNVIISSFPLMPPGFGIYFQKGETLIGHLSLHL